MVTRYVLHDACKLFVSFISVHIFNTRSDILHTNTYGNMCGVPSPRPGLSVLSNNVNSAVVSKVYA